MGWVVKQLCPFAKHTWLGERNSIAERLAVDSSCVRSRLMLHPVGEWDHHRMGQAESGRLI